MIRVLPIPILKTCRQQASLVSKSWHFPVPTSLHSTMRWVSVSQKPDEPQEHLSLGTLAWLFFIITPPLQQHSFTSKLVMGCRIVKRLKIYHLIPKLYSTVDQRVLGDGEFVWRTQPLSRFGPNIGGSFCPLIAGFSSRDLGWQDPRKWLQILFLYISCLTPLITSSYFQTFLMRDLIFSLVSGETSHLPWALQAWTWHLFSISSSVAARTV